jgi:hypothetical protein|tara:strand:+ start:28336 stop:28566 length:231 start_codon:yes stop_codon:yes gene_type:complete
MAEMKCLMSSTKKILKTALKSDIENLQSNGLMITMFELTNPEDKKDQKEIEQELESIYNDLEEALEFVKSIPECGD